jgi:UPF0716 family protein affecting phage T7 exclusion
MIYLYLIGFIAFFIALLYLMAFANRLMHGALKWRGVTELTSKQRRGMARKYRETTGSGAPKTRKRRRRARKESR